MVLGISCITQIQVREVFDQPGAFSEAPPYVLVLRPGHHALGRSRLSTISRELSAAEVTTRRDVAEMFFALRGCGPNTSFATSRPQRMCLHDLQTRSRERSTQANPMLR
jgi:hypothetical protein